MFESLDTNFAAHRQHKDEAEKTMQALMTLAQHTYGLYRVKMKAAKGKGTVKDKKEVLKPVNDKRVGKRKAATKEENSRTILTKKEKLASKDPNKPKRPPSAFFAFLEDFRNTYKLENPHVKGVAVVCHISSSAIEGGI